MVTAPPFNLLTHNGCITVVNRKTGTHRTFKVSTVRNGKLEGKRIVSILSGSDNTTDYRGFGFVTPDGIVLFKKDRTDFFRTVADMLIHPEQWEEKAEFKFEGRCIRCNRLLTHPESIDSGIGPECAKK